MSKAAAATRGMKSAAEPGLIAKLQSIKIGGSAADGLKIKRRDLVYILRNLATLVDNGLSLPKSLATIAKEKSLAKYAGLLDSVRRKVESGESFSGALAKYPDTFNAVMVNQIKIGERSGTLPATLVQLVDQLEKSEDLKGQIVKKLAYPMILVGAGSLAVTFMLMFVVPVFEETYADSGVALPAVTQLLIHVGAVAKGYWWLFLGGGAAAVAVLRYVRKNPAGAKWMDTKLLGVPFVGEMMRNVAVLQFMDVMGNLLDAGFTVADALKVSAHGVGNRAVREAIEGLHAAVVRGERFSRELDRHADLFPPVVLQLVIVGEQTGTLPKATADIRTHLRRQIERQTNLLVGTIEPVLTIGLAAAIGTILLAIYLPMFDMINAMNPEGV